MKEEERIAAREKVLDEMEKLNLRQPKTPKEVKNHRKRMEELRDEFDALTIA